MTGDRRSVEKLPPGRAAAPDHVKPPLPPGYTWTHVQITPDATTDVVTCDTDVARALADGPSGTRPGLRPTREFMNDVRAVDPFGGLFFDLRAADVMCGGGIAILIFLGYAAANSWVSLTHLVQFGLVAFAMIAIMAPSTTAWHAWRAPHRRADRAHRWATYQKYIDDHHDTIFGSLRRPVTALSEEHTVHRPDLAGDAVVDLAKTFGDLIDEATTLYDDVATQGLTPVFSPAEVNDLARPALDEQITVRRLRREISEMEQITDTVQPDDPDPDIAAMRHRIDAAYRQISELLQSVRSSTSQARTGVDELKRQHMRVTAQLNAVHYLREHPKQREVG